MQAFQPEQAKFLLTAIYLPTLGNEHGVTRSVIEAIPADKSDFRPDGISKSALDLASHIVTAEFRFLDGVAAGAFDFTPHPLPESVRTPADLAAWYAENFAPRLARLRQLTGEQLGQIIDFRGRYQMPAVMYLGRMLHHTVHHRGQLSAYLRPMGAKIPAIYGESYDSAAAKQTA
ncbi:MAG TPA: DinB family protein [Bryobacteraceae bacterium]|nr:DinB family protein [Bryobacteraceae bacterium]